MGRFHRRPPGELQERPDRSVAGGLSGAMPGAGIQSWTKGAVSIKIVGVKGLFRKFGKIKRAGQTGSASSLYQEAETIMGMAKMPKNVPVLTGALRSSGKVYPPSISNRRIIVKLGFGGPGVNYALIQHEGDFQHPRGGRKHYLLAPTLERLPMMKMSIGKSLGVHIIRAGKSEKLA